MNTVCIASIHLANLKTSIANVHGHKLNKLNRFNRKFFHYQIKGYIVLNSASLLNDFLYRPEKCEKDVRIGGFPGPKIIYSACRDCFKVFLTQALYIILIYYHKNLVKLYFFQGEQCNHR